MPRERRRQLRHALGEQADQVDSVDMEALGRNPPRIIPTWRAFLTVRYTRAHPPRGVGDPIWPGRSPAEMDEWARHEALPHRAFGGGTGRLRLWTESGAAVCEVRDRGHIHDPLVGRRVPEPDRPGERGLGLVNQLCDLVGPRSGPGGTVARVRVDRVGARTPALAAEAARRLAILHGRWHAAVDRGLEAGDGSALGALSADARALLLRTAPGRSLAALPSQSGEGEPPTGPAVSELLGRGLLDPASPRGRGLLRFTREAVRLRSAWEVAARRAGEQQLAQLGPDGAATLVRVLEGVLPGG